MTARRIANENRPPSDFLTVSQVAAALACDRSTVYDLITKGELLGVRPFSPTGNFRIPRESYEAYQARKIRQATAAFVEPPSQDPKDGKPAQQRRRRIAAGTPAQREAEDFWRQRGACS